MKIREKKPRSNESQENNISFCKSDEKNDSFFITLYIKPNTKHEKLYFDSNKLFLDISAPPVKGKANFAIINFLANRLNISKSSIIIIKGQKSSIKTIKITSSFSSKDSFQEKLINKFSS